MKQQQNNADDRKAGELQFAKIVDDRGKRKANQRNGENRTC